MLLRIVGTACHGASHGCCAASSALTSLASSSGCHMQFRVLGPLEVVENGEPLKLVGAKQRSLLAILLLRANEVISRDALIDGLRGEKPPAGAGHSLEEHVSRLRKHLHRNGQDLLLTRPGGYMLSIADGELDLDRFERLARDGREALRSGERERAAKLLRQALSL